jgi:hypothetical protein
LFLDFWHTAITADHQTATVTGKTINDRGDPEQEIAEMRKTV